MRIRNKKSIIGSENAGLAYGSQYKKSRRRQFWPACHDKNEALKLLIGDKSIEKFTRQMDVDSFEEGLDSIPDVPLSFSIDDSDYSSRRVRVDVSREF